MILKKTTVSNNNNNINDELIVLTRQPYHLESTNLSFDQGVTLRRVWSVGSPWRNWRNKSGLDAVTPFHVKNN
jgi:hypothetical protein